MLGVSEKDAHVLCEQAAVALLDATAVMLDVLASIQLEGVPQLGTLTLNQMTAVQMAIVGPLMWLILAGILFAVFNAAMGGDSSFKQVFAVVAYSSAITIIQQLFVTPLNYVRETMSSATNLAVFLPMLDEGSFLAKFLGTVDLFIVWWVVVLSIGLAAGIFKPLISGTVRATTDKTGQQEGDPLNLVFIGTEEDLASLAGCGWDQTERLTVGTGWHTFKSFLLGSHYRYSPMSSLYYSGRHQDLAFQ